MARLSKVQKLSTDQLQTVETTIRQHHYAQLDEMLTVLGAQGIELSRSALHRYVKRLSARDAERSDRRNTVVIIVSRSTGATATLHTSATADQILEEIEALTASS